MKAIYIKVILFTLFFSVLSPGTSFATEMKWYHAGGVFGEIIKIDFNTTTTKLDVDKNDDPTKPYDVITLVSADITFKIWHDCLGEHNSIISGVNNTDQLQFMASLKPINKGKAYDVYEMVFGVASTYSRRQEICLEGTRDAYPEIDDIPTIEVTTSVQLVTSFAFDNGFEDRVIELRYPVGATSEGLITDGTPIWSSLKIYLNQSNSFIALKEKVR